MATIKSCKGAESKLRNLASLQGLLRDLPFARSPRFGLLAAGIPALRMRNHIDSSERINSRHQPSRQRPRRTAAHRRSARLPARSRLQRLRQSLRLIGQVITVSLETQAIIAALPTLNLGA